MLKTLATALSAAVVLAACSAGATPSQAATHRRVVDVRSMKVYLAPKIDQAGTTPSSAGNAAAAGSAQMIPADTTRTMTVQHRPAGSTGPWVTLTSGKPTSGGYIYFRGWSTDEYRAVTPAYGGDPTVTSPTVGYGWDTAFSDEFNGTTLDPAWAPRGTTTTDGMTRAHSDPSACAVDSGVLHLRAIPDPDRPGSYLDCHVGTQDSFSFVHGWAAARVRFHRYAGSHSGFWLQSTPGYVPGSAEVDVAEDFGSSGNIYQSVYWDWTPDGSDLLQDQAITTETEAKLPTGQHWWDSYHVVSVRWTSTQYQFWVDDTKVYSTTKGVSTNPEYLVLSMLTRDFEVDAMRDDQLDTYSMDVDWVRVWQ